MAKLIMLIGLPASGKSTYANKLKEDGYTVHSSDSIREELFDNINFQGENELVFKMLHDRIKEDLIDGENVVYDATNMGMKRRRSFLETLNKVECTKVAVVMATPFNECIDRNKSRDRTLDAHVLDRMYKSFQFPMLQEGFDEIEIEYTTDEIDHQEMFNQLEFLANVLQHNSNHTLTIGEHCLRVCGLLSCESKELRIAGLLHDIGKLKTMSFRNSKGEYTNQAHYYNHENISTYDAMEYLRIREEDTAKVCQIITYHMKPHVLKTEKSINKFKRFCGEEFWNELMIFNKADKEAR